MGKGKPQKWYFFSGPATKALPTNPSNLVAINTYFILILKIAENGFWQKKSQFFGLKEPYLDVIWTSVTKDITPQKNPLNKICFILDWEQNKKEFKKTKFFCGFPKHCLPCIICFLVGLTRVRQWKFKCRENTPRSTKRHFQKNVCAKLRTQGGEGVNTCPPPLVYVGDIHNTQSITVI